MNVICALLDIQLNPINRRGEKVTPVVWEDGCLEEVCGSCSMLINGRPRQACTALVEKILEQNGQEPIVLAPLSKFPLVRDLRVDRSVMFQNLKKVHAWVDVDSTFERGPGPKIDQVKQDLMYSLSQCMTCGCCAEACPQMNEHSAFIGPATVAQVWYFNLHPIGQYKKGERLRVMMEKGGISDCGNAQNCVRVCPKNLPLTDAISAIGRQTTLQAFKQLFSFPDLLE